MTTYAGIFGGRVDYVSSDPSNPFVGQVWYNATSAALKYFSQTTSGTWASSGNLNTARSGAGGSGNGSPTASLIFGGVTSAPADSAATEKYNGTSWTNNPTGLNTARQNGGSFGTQTASIYAGGYPTQTTTESWGGTSWTNATGINTAREYLTGGAGPQTTGMIAGGYIRGPNVASGATEKYNGSSWTSSGSMSLARYVPRVLGTSNTAAIVVSGTTTLGISTQVESFNGSTWSAGTSIPIGRNTMGGAGTQTSALTFGGSNPTSPSYKNTAEFYNGTTWTTTGNLTNSSEWNSSSGSTQTAALAFGGNNGGVIAATEAFTGPGTPTTKTVTVS